MSPSGRANIFLCLSLLTAHSCCGFAIRSRNCFRRCSRTSRSSGPGFARPIARKRCNANPPAAFPATPPPMNQPCIPQKPCSLPAPIATAAIRPPASSPGTAPTSPDYLAAKQKAHVQPKNAAFKNRSAIPERAFTKWLTESYEYIKFVNPGDLRVAPETCGAAGCHASETRAVSTSMMTHSGMLWGAALYNNGGLPREKYPFRRKLRPRWQAAIHKNVSVANTGRNSHQRRLAAARSSLSLGNFAARQRASRIRTRRPQKK